MPRTIKPIGKLSATTAHTGTGGVDTITYSPGEFAEPIHLTATSTGVDTVRKQWVVGVPNLHPILSGPDIRLIGSLGAHPLNHYGSDSIIADLNEAAILIDTVYHKPLVVNDMSLPFGGKVDLDSAWDTLSTHHVLHRLGLSADIRIIPDSMDHLLDGLTTDSERQKLIRFWVKHPNHYFTLEGTPPHIHLQYWVPNR